MERGLSENTLAAYRTDLKRFAAWLDARGTRLLDAKRADVLEFLASMVEAPPRSIARRLSSLRRFYLYQCRERAVAEDPCARVDAPKLGRPLPDTLTEAEVESLLGAPDTAEALGLRDRSMLEVLYATGLRVSELTSLTTTQINRQQGVLRVSGKGNKERLVPLGEEALDWLERYAGGARAEILGTRQSDALFPSRAGRAMSRQAFWQEPRRRSSRGANAARAQRYFDHPDLHPRSEGTLERSPSAPSSSRLSGIRSVLFPGEPCTTCTSIQRSTRAHAAEVSPRQLPACPSTRSPWDSVCLSFR
jgi:integrase/recombinase XerD